MIVIDSYLTANYLFKSLKNRHEFRVFLTEQELESLVLSLGIVSVSLIVFPLLIVWKTLISISNNKKYSANNISRKSSSEDQPLSQAFHSIGWDFFRKN